MSEAVPSVPRSLARSIGRIALLLAAAILMGLLTDLVRKRPLVFPRPPAVFSPL